MTNPGDTANYERSIYNEPQEIVDGTYYPDTNTSNSDTSYNDVPDYTFPSDGATVLGGVIAETLEQMYPGAFTTMRTTPRARVVTPKTWSYTFVAPAAGSSPQVSVIGRNDSRKALFIGVDSASATPVFFNFQGNVNDPGSYGISPGSRIEIDASDAVFVYSYGSARLSVYEESWGSEQ